MIFAETIWFYRRPIKNKKDIGRGFTINIPLSEETDDEAYIKVFDRVVTPAVTQFKPSAAKDSKVLT